MLTLRRSGRPLAALLVLTVPHGTAASSRLAIDQPFAPDREHDFGSVARVLARPESEGQLRCTAAQRVVRL
jgi:hypothetical protein